MIVRYLQCSTDGRWIYIVDFGIAGCFNDSSRDFIDFRLPKKSVYIMYREWDADGPQTTDCLRPVVVSNWKFAGKYIYKYIPNGEVYRNEWTVNWAIHL